MTIRRGDILWADLSMFPTTSVQGGVRPVIVVSNNKANTCANLCYDMPRMRGNSNRKKMPVYQGNTVNSRSFT